MPMKNCLTYALRKWRREGGYVVIRRSLAAHYFGIDSRWHPVNWIPHFLHLSTDGILSQYAPTPDLVEKHCGLKKQGKSLWKFWLALWNFEGHIVFGDAEYLSLSRSMTASGVLSDAQGRAVSVQLHRDLQYRPRSKSGSKFFVWRELSCGRQNFLPSGKPAAFDTVSQRPSTSKETPLTIMDTGSTTVT